MPATIELPRIELTVPTDTRPLGTRVLAGLLGLATAGMRQVEGLASRPGRPIAAMSRIRGTGRGVHFGEYIRAMEAEHPLTLQCPFEGSYLVSGAAWVATELFARESADGGPIDVAVAKLRWDAGADDLPLHVHDHSARFIIVLEGRGYFHVSDRSAESFDGGGVRSVPARERDIFAFTPKLLHTFSTAGSAMTLLSVQMPYLAFDDPDQYRVPSVRWTARDNPEQVTPKVACDPWWAIGLGGG